jgi:arylsulfatase A-like enzyme
MKIQLQKAALGIIPISLLPLHDSLAQENTADLPNILWIVSEDNSAYFTGCYGNPLATTPNIDKLASEGFLYTRAYTSNAVSAPTRNSILTGVYSCSNGNENMRSTYPKSDIVRTYPEYLRQAGYYCTNNSKTDYNTSSVNEHLIWDESSNNAHYQNRPKGKPFFAVFNSSISHESCLFMHGPATPDKLKQDPDKVALPPYHPDLPEIRYDWAQYYDAVETMDAWVGQMLKELEESGLAENTIVMYYGDNGGVLPRSKRFLYETGTRIPLIIRIPEKYKHLYPAEKPGSKIDRIVNFIDLVPTLLSISNLPIPSYIQGKAFLGNQKTADPEYTFLSRQRMDERFDNVRGVRDQKYRYIRNYMPFRITMQRIEYLFRAQSAQAWEKAFREGKTNEIQSMFFMEKPVEELYDVENDPWEVNNLANDPKYAAVLDRMRKALDDWRMEIYDAGVIPETEYGVLAGDKSLYDYVRSPECPFEEMLKASDLAVMGDVSNLPTYIKNLESDNSAIRYWGAVGLLMLGDEGIKAVPALMKAAADQSASVATIAAEALYRLGMKDAASKTYVRLLDAEAYDLISRTFAMNSIDAVDANTPEIVAAMLKLKQDLESSFKPEANPEYDMSVMKYMLRRWNMID